MTESTATIDAPAEDIGTPDPQAKKDGTTSPEFGAAPVPTVPAPTWAPRSFAADTLGVVDRQGEALMVIQLVLPGEQAGPILAMADQRFQEFRERVQELLAQSPEFAAWKRVTDRLAALENKAANLRSRIETDTTAADDMLTALDGPTDEELVETISASNGDKAILKSLDDNLPKLRRMATEHAAKVRGRGKEIALAECNREWATIAADEANLSGLIEQAADALDRLLLLAAVRSLFHSPLTDAATEQAINHVMPTAPAPEQPMQAAQPVVPPQQPPTLSRPQYPGAVQYV
jgi:hypothetical protein